MATTTDQIAPMNGGPLPVKTVSVRRSSAAPPKSRAFQVVQRRDSSISDVPRADTLDNSTLLDVQAMKRWWRQRACVFENLSVLSARKLQRANVQLKHRESQLRDAVFLVNWLKNKAVLHPDDSGETEAELRAGKLLHASSETLHHADEDSLVAAAAAAVDLDQPQPDYYEDEVRRLMSNLEKQVTPLLAEYDGEPDFESTTDAEEWRSKHHTGYVLLKHWKRRCLEAEATVHRLLRDQPQSVPVEMPIADFKAEEKEPRHVRHTAFIADMLNQTNRILSRDDDREVDLQNHIDLDRKSVKTVAKSSKQARPAAVLKSSPTKAKHNTGKHQRRITASPDNTSVDIDPTFWKQRFLARDIEFRDKARELNDCQHLLSKQFREVDQLRRESTKRNSVISALQKELDHARHLNESYRGNIIKQKAFLGGLDNTVEERHRAIKQLELEMDAMKVKARNEMEAEREEILKASRVLQQENYALFNEVHVRTVLLEDQLARARTMFTTIDGTISSSATLFEGLPAGRMQLFNEELEAIEKSVNNMKAYLKLRRPQEFAAEPLSTLSDATDLDAARKTITSANVDEQLQDLLIRLEKGIEFVKKRIVIKAEVDAQTRNHDKTVLIHRYHYEQFLHYLQYLRDLVRLSRQGNSSTSSGDGKHPIPTHRISSEAVRFQRHYAPHLYRLYAVQATIALKTAESVYEIDTILSHVHAASEGTRVNVNGMLVQVHGLQEEISKLRKASTETIQLVTNKYRQAKKSARELQKTVEQLQQEKLIADAAKLFPDKEE